MIPLLLAWIQLRLLQTLRRIIRNLFHPTNLSRRTNPKRMSIVNLVHILLLTKQMRKDVKNIYHQVHELYNGECMIPLNKRNTKNPKLLPQGNPICEAGLAMWKDGKFSDSGRTRQKFCCPLKAIRNADCPCRHKNFYNGKKHRGCTKYITIPDDLRLSLDRDSKYFKSNYSLRTECEWYNSRFKNTGQERMWVRNKSSVTNLNTLAHISLLAVAVAAITSGTGQSYRKLKAVKRTA